jgi:hypothetical protein
MDKTGMIELTGNNPTLLAPPVKNQIIKVYYKYILKVLEDQRDIYAELGHEGDPPFTTHTKNVKDAKTGKTSQITLPFETLSSMQSTEELKKKISKDKATAKKEGDASYVAPEIPKTEKMTSVTGDVGYLFQFIFNGLIYDAVKVNDVSNGSPLADLVSNSANYSEYDHTISKFVYTLSQKYKEMVPLFIPGDYGLQSYLEGKSKDIIKQDFVAPIISMNFSIFVRAMAIRTAMAIWAHGKKTTANLRLVEGIVQGEKVTLGFELNPLVYEYVDEWIKSMKKKPDATEKTADADASISTTTTGAPADSANIAVVPTVAAAPIDFGETEAPE